MENLSFGLITLFNGAYKITSNLFSPLTLIVILLGISIFWFFLIELDEYNRTGAKPNVGRH